MSFLALNLLDSGVQLSMLCAVIGLIFAFVLIAIVARSPAGNERMRQISGAVLEGAKAYLNRQVVTISVIAVVIFILLFVFKDHPTAIGFVIGAFCSLAAGFIGMRIAVIANVRTTQAASQSRTAALRIAFNGGAVTGLLVVGLALLAVAIFYTVAGKMVGHDKAVRSLVGLALGASLISVFARLGGGIYTKAADVGADLVGKIEKGLEEDDPRNPATIADNVGDNVGDCAGMAADLFESYEVTLVASIILRAAAFHSLFPDEPSRWLIGLIFPLVARAIGVRASLVVVYAVPATDLGVALALGNGNIQFSLYLVALTGMGMLATTGVVVSEDTFGPVSDNAAGIAEMSGEFEGEPERIMVSLDAVGNTTKAVTKGFAIGSAVIAAVALFASFIETVGSELNVKETGSALFHHPLTQINVADPKTFIGLLIGGAVPFLFSGRAIRAVGRTAGTVVQE